VRNQKAFRICLLLAGGVFFFCLFAWYGAVPMNYFPLFIAVAYFVYLFILLGLEEQRILRYIKSKDSMIGTEYLLRYDAHTISIEVIKTKERLQCAIKKFPAAVETGAFYLLYTDAATCYIVPTYALTQEQRVLLRQALADNLGQRFMSRFVEQ